MIKSDFKNLLIFQMCSKPFEEDRQLQTPSQAFKKSITTSAILALQSSLAFIRTKASKAAKLLKIMLVLGRPLYTNHCVETGPA